MSTTPAATPVEVVHVSEAVRTMADLIKSNMTMGEHGVIEVGDRTLVECLKSQDLEPEILQKVQDSRDLIMASQGLAVGELALENFIKHPDLKLVSSTFKFGNDASNATYHRERKVPSGEGDTRMVKGSLSMNYRVSGESSTKNPLKQVKAHLSAEAKRILAD
jgi:hypothetical protein